MALKNMSLLSSATVAVTGGTALVFADNGITIANGLQLTVPADVDYQTRRVVTAKVKPPAITVGSGQYGKDKKSLTYVTPIVLTDGRVIFNTIRVERELHPSLTIAQAAEINKIGAQMLVDADTDGFWATGSLS